MRRAHQLRREQGLDLSAAMKASWAEAKTGKPATFEPVLATQGAQEAGIGATLRRYGLDHLAARAKAFVAHLQTELRALADRRRARILPPHAGQRLRQGGTAREATRYRSLEAS